MEKIIIIILFFSSTLVFSQSDFSIMKTDDSHFPLVEVWVKADSGSVNSENIRLYSDEEKNISYELEKIEGARFAQETNIFLLIFLVNKGSENIELLKQVTQFIEKDAQGFKYNIGIVKELNDKSTFELLSPEFSDDNEYFIERLAKVDLNSDSLTSINSALKKALSYIKTRELHRKNNSIFALGYSLPIKKNKQILLDVQKSEVHFYSALCDSLSLKNEQKLISLSSEAGGIYSNTKCKEFSEILKKYSNDALMFSHFSGYEIFKLKFECKNRKHKNYTVISNGTHRESFVFYSKGLISEILIYQLLLIVLVIISVFFGLRYYIQKRRINYLRLMNERRNTIPDSDKTVVLNIKSEGITQRVELSEDKCTIGRHKKNNIVLEDDTVSAFHAVVKKEAGFYYVVDKGSTNGIYIDGKRIIKERLSRNKLMKLGEVYIKVSYE